MEILYLAISVTVLMNPNDDGTPAVSAVPQRFYETFEECDNWRQGRYADPWSDIDPVSGKAVERYIYTCTPQFMDDVRKRLDRLPEQE